MEELPAPQPAQPPAQRCSLHQADQVCRELVGVALRFMQGWGVGGRVREEGRQAGSNEMVL